MQQYMHKAFAISIAILILTILWGYHPDQLSWWYSTTTSPTAHHWLGWWGATIAGTLYALWGNLTLLLPVILLIMQHLHHRYQRAALGMLLCLVSMLAELVTAPPLVHKGNGGSVGRLLLEMLTAAIAPPYHLAFIITSSTLATILLIGTHRSAHILRRIIRGGAAACTLCGAYIMHLWRSIRWKLTPPVHNPASIREAQPVQHEIPRTPSEASISTTSYRLPAIATMWKRTARTTPSRTSEEYRQQADILTDKLAQLGIQGTVNAITVGPVLVTFEYIPHQDVPLSKILAREDDLALALQAQSIRIIAPIPGKAAVGFECNRREREPVLFVDHWESLWGNYQLPLLIGLSPYGAPVVLDLAQLPHLLVAGATGSGKSVTLHALITSMLITKKPDELKLILIDPKRLEFVGYADIPHLLFPIIINTQEALLVLRWAVQEMERRYTLLAHAQVTNIAAYRAAGNLLPDIVIIIDEWADLIMSGGKDAEHSLVRITQMARAAGIHAIVATQRPSVDVITGIIKANIPARIACKVSSKIDSRTILDTIGAERLLGKGDMLIMVAGTHPERMHGAYLSSTEIQAVVCAVRRQSGACYVDLATLHQNVALQVAPEDAELYTQVVALIQTVDEISISSLQRRLRIGYNRSARMIDYLEAHGMILPSEGAKARKVLR